MADWYGHARSNYFRVKDLNAFRKAMEPLDDISIHGKGDRSEILEDGFICLLVDNGDKGGWPAWLYNEVTDEDYEVELTKVIAEHLVDGDVAILMECGAEKLRYVTGWAVAVNSKGEEKGVSLDDIYQLAATLGPNVTPVSY